PDLLPGLNRVAIDDLPRDDLGRVMAAVERLGGRVLAERETREWLLREVYGISLPALQTPKGLIRYLIERHYGGAELSPSLDGFLAERLAPFHPTLATELLGLLSSRQRWYAWLQEEWQRYVASHGRPGIREERVPF